MLIMAVATLAGMSQLYFLIALVNQAARDALTGVYARQSGEELLRLAFAQAQRMDRPLAVAFIDLDDFKQVNDLYGHEEGDQILRRFAARLQQGLRTSDIVIRWGGEEFVAILPDTDSDGALIALHRLARGGFGLRPDGRPQTASIGIAECRPGAFTSPAELVDCADQRMYLAKQAGKNRICSAEDCVVQ